MTSPLEVSTAASKASLVRAEVAFAQAKANARIASMAAYVLISAAFVAFFVFELHVGSLVVLAGAGILVMVAQQRANVLERRLWWHQARNGLVEALSERQVIDLRERSQKTK